MNPPRSRILYGLCGEGLGHFARASFLVPKLLDAGYDVELFTSGRVADRCAERFPDCPIHRIPGLRMVYRNNALNVPGTVFNYTSLGIRGFRALRNTVKRGHRQPPVAAISDYDPIVARAASALRVPLITLDHQQVATECEIDPAVPRGLKGLLLRMSNRMTYPRPSLRIMTSFFRLPLRPQPRRAETDRIMVGPVLRPQVVNRRPGDGSHILVYQTSRTLQWLDLILAELPGEKRVYGVGRQQSGQQERAFSEEAFLDDLASCRFALVNGGHTTISEALHFGKPVICLPVRGQAEQELNAHYVEKLGFGRRYLPEKGQVLDFGTFLAEEESTRRTIAQNREPCGNSDLLSTVLGRLTEWRDHT